MSGDLRVVVAGGAGRVGRLFAELLRPAGRVVALDLANGAAAGAGAAELRRCDVTAPDRDVERLLASADVVVLALPEAAALAAVDVVTALLRPGALLVDTCSAKGRLLPRLARLAEAAGVECLSLNPMFAPELGLDRRPVAVVPVREGPLGERVTALLAGAGGRLVPVDARDYEHLAAVLQVATHAAVLAFGTVASRHAVALDTLVRLGPPPFQLLLSLLARMASGTPTVYRDIQAAGAAAGRAREDLAAAVADLGVAATADDPAAFHTLMADLSAWLGPHRAPLAERCAELFEQVELSTAVAATTARRHP